MVQGLGIAIYKVPQSLDRLSGFQEFEAPKFQEIWHMKFVKVFGPRHHRPLTPGNIPWTHFR